MTCSAEYRERLLELDLEQLREALSTGSGSDVARHVSACRACRESVEALLTANQGLADILSAPGAPPDIEALLDRAEREGFRRPAASGVIGLLAAAAVSGLLLVGDRLGSSTDEGDGGGGIPSAADVPASRRTVPMVEVPEGRNAAVLPTHNPDVTVVWLF